MNLFTDIIAPTQITPTRSFNLTYIILDSIFILVLLLFLLFKKKYITLIWSLFGGILYFIVDYGGFHLLSGTREVLIDNLVQGEMNTALVLLWMSLSYGITNFCFIWLLLKNDKDKWLFLLMIVGWWIACPVLSLAGGKSNIVTRRTTDAYHWIMALFLVVGYLLLIAYKLFKKEKRNLFSLLTLNLIGIAVQGCWEIALLLNGIRPMNDMSVKTVIVNSLIETNMGLPYMWLIYFYVSRKWNDDLTPFTGVKRCLFKPDPLDLKEEN